jgi:hypothetical protein
VTTRGQRWVALGLVVACAGCTGGAGKGTTDHSFDDYCALAELPSTTTADLEQLQQRSTAAAAAHRGKVVEDTARGPAVVRAALELNLAIEPALRELQATGMEDQPPTGLPTVAAVIRAQTELHAACTR